MIVWLDIDNPPQVQYLCPFWEYLRDESSLQVVLTARDNGSTIALIRQRGINPLVFGRASGAGRVQKVWATFLRALRLSAYFLRSGRPDVLISSSRSSALAARLLGIPAYIFCDYEHAELESYRKLGATILFPAVIGSQHFESLGFPRSRLMPFRGLKEDISFRGVETDAVEPLSLVQDEGLVRVLLRPPAAKSHYHRTASDALYYDILRNLSARPEAITVFSPRYPEQTLDLDAFSWTHPPVVLDNTANFVSLLKGVDVVISSGGTMLREAAYLGVPAISIFLGPRGAVDTYLESRGLLIFVTSLREFGALEFRKKAGGPRLKRTTHVVEAIIDEIRASL